MGETAVDMVPGNGKVVSLSNELDSVSLLMHSMTFLFALQISNHVVQLQFMILGILAEQLLENLFYFFVEICQFKPLSLKRHFFPFFDRDLLRND